MTERMNSTSDLVLDLSLPKSKDQEMVENSVAIDESFKNSDEPQDFSVTRSTGQIIFKTGDNERNFQQSFVPNKKGFPLNSATTLKRRGPVIDPYIPPSPHPKIRKIPPPLTTGASPHPWNMTVKSLAQTTSSAQHVIAASPLATQKQPQTIPIGAFQVNKMRHLTPNAATIQTPPRFHGPTSVTQFTRFAQVGAQTFPSNINPYNIAGVTPLIHRPSVAKPSTNQSNVGILKGPTQRILLPGQRTPTTLIANQIAAGSQKPAFNNYAISSNQAITQSSSQGQQHNLSNASSQIAEEMPRHNNPFMAPVGRQETVKQTRVAFRNSPEFSLVHVQHSTPVKQNNNLPHIMPKQAKLTHVASKATSNQPMTMTPQQPLGDQIPNGRGGNIQRPPIVSNSMNRPLQIMRPARQVFPVSVNQSVSMFQKSTQQTSTPHVYPSNQLNLLAYKKPQFAGNPNVQVVATPVAQIMPPQLSRASTLQNQNHLIPRGPPSASNPVMRAQANPLFSAQQVKEGVSSMSQNRFLNPPNGVRPLVSKPLPTSQNIVQQQKIVASLAASLTSSSVLTSGPRFLNPQPPAQGQLAKHSINSTANAVGTSKISMNPAKATAPRLLNPFHPGAVVPPPPLVKAEEIASQSLSTAQQQFSSAAAASVAVAHANASSSKDCKFLPAAATDSATAFAASTATQNCSKTAIGSKITQEERAEDAVVSNSTKIKSENSQQSSVVPKTEELSHIFSPNDLLDAKVVSYAKDLQSNNYEFKWLRSTEPGEVAFVATPDCCFIHLSKCKEDDLPENMVIEVPSSLEKGTWWVATILYSCRQHIIIRYAGFVDTSYDMWIDLQTTDIHPIGWCKKTGNQLEPPEHFPLQILESETKHGDKLPSPGAASNSKEDEKSNKDVSVVIKQEPNLDVMTQKSRQFLRNFVVNKYSVHESFLEQRLFWPVEMRIPLNARMEYEYEPRKIWLVKIINNYSGLLRLRYEGVPDSETKHDLLSIYTSTKLHGVGYAMKSVNMLMEPPKFLWNYCATQTEMVKSYQSGWAKNEELRVRMPKMFFEPINENPKSNRSTAGSNVSASDIRITSLKGCLNTKLEVIFSKFSHLICVATVTEVIDDETFRVTLDDYNKNGSKHSQVFNLSSFGLFPALWCSNKNVHLTPPLNYNYTATKYARVDFDWHDYLIENCTRCFPDYLLKPHKPQSKTPVFEVGQKLEAINPFHPDQINPCTIKRVIDDKVLLLGIDGWVSSTGSPVTFFADAMGESIFPARWCESVGFTMRLPWEMPLEKRTLIDFDLSSVFKQEATDEVEIESLCKTETTESETCVDQPVQTHDSTSRPMEFACDVKIFSSVPSESDLKLYWSNFNHPFWCPKVYVNYGCCKSSLISRYKLSCLREHFGPGLSIYVIRAMLNALINCSFKPQQVFTQVYSASTHFESTGSSPAYIKAKCRNKNLRALVKLPEKLTEMKDFLMCVLKKLGCCPDLFSFKYYEDKVCGSVDCVSLQNKTSHNELINDYQPVSPNGICSNRNRNTCKSKKRKKKKMLFSSQKRNTAQTKCSSDTQKSSCSSLVVVKRQLNNCVKSLSIKDGMVSDGSLPNSRPVTPRSESPVDADLDKFIIVEPKRGFSKLKKGVVNGGVGNPPEREKSKRHKSVFSTVNMIARHELDQEDYLLQATQSIIPLTEQQNEESHSSCPPEKTAPELKNENDSSVVSTSSACKRTSKLNSSSRHQKSLALKKRTKVSTSAGLAGKVAKTSSKKTNKLRKFSFSSSQNSKETEASTNGATLADRKSIHRLKAASSVSATATKNQTRLLSTRSAKTLDKGDPLKWSTEDLCLHLNTTECADFLPFIRKECIDGQSFILLTFAYLTDVCEVKKDLAAKICYQVAKLKKQYLDDPNLASTPASSAMSNCSYKYTEENNL